LGQDPNSLQAQQKIQRKPAPDPDKPSTAQTMNPPARPPPNLPPYEAIQNVQRPAPPQYGFTTGATQAGWTQPSTQQHPSQHPQPAQASLTNSTSHPYEERLNQTFRKESYQPVQQVQYNGPWRPQPAVYREQTGYDPRLVTQQGQQRRVAENTEAGRLVNYDPRLLSRREGQERRMSQSAETSRVASYDPRTVSNQREQAYQAAESPEPRSLSSQEQRLPLNQGGYQRRISEDTEPGRFANYDPRLISTQQEQPRRVSESAEPIRLADYDPRQASYREGQQHRVVEDTQTSRPAYRNISAPQQPIPQGLSNYLPPTTLSDINRPQKTEQPPTSTEAPQNATVVQGKSRPPIPQGYRSTSQPPGPRTVRQPSPQSKTLHKPSQADINALQLPQSPDASPRGSPALHGRGRSDSLVAPPTTGDISTLHDSSSQPNSYHSDAGSSDGKSSKRRSWLPVKSRQSSQDMAALMNGPGAWVIGGPNRISYNVEPLFSAKKVLTFSSVRLHETKS
jgi:hypothetical protein